MYYTYMIRCNDNSIYTGITTDVKRRFLEHSSQSYKSAKYTRVRKVVSLEAVWESENRAFASKLEYQIKKLTKTQKEKLIEKNNFDFFGDKIEAEKYNRLK